MYWCGGHGRVESLLSKDKGEGFGEEGWLGKGINWRGRRH